MLKYLSLFSGIGAFESALTNLGVDYEVVNYCEIDKFASKSYSAIHGIPETKNLWDITKVNVFNLPTDIDLVTYGFPCQDISLAGHQKGLFNEDGSLTRSGLFFKALDVIEYCKPKVAIAENVKNLVGKKFKPQFDIVLDSLDKVGYNNYWKVLNAKDYGIPQNRERVFIVSIRKDIDNELFEFPKPYSLEKRLKDFLEPRVDEKYYLSDKMYTFFSENTKKQEEKGNGFRFLPTDGNTIAKSITTRAGNRMDDNFIIQRVHGFNLGGNKGDVCPSITSNSFQHNNFVFKNNNVRKLTPKECYRLMGFSDEEFERAENVPTSNTQLYKQAGDSIVVDVLEELFCMLLDEQGDLYV